jgi:5-methylcytosine-specific restriction endonuclease McrA
MFKRPSGRKAVKIQLKKFKTNNLYGEDWKEISNKVRTRDNWTCQDCKKNFEKKKYLLHTHHIIELSKGGNNTNTNLKSLCKDCHDKIHRR